MTKLELNSNELNLVQTALDSYIEQKAASKNADNCATQIGHAYLLKLKINQASTAPAVDTSAPVRYIGPSA